MTAAKKLTVDELFARGDDIRDELIHGEVVPKAAPNWPHNSAEDRLFLWAGRRFGRKPGGRWPGGWWIGTELHVVYGPYETFCHDIAGWRRDHVEEMPHERIAIRPDWVCEVLSPSHKARDLVDKLAVMHAAGVPDYWVVDHRERILFLYQHAASGYVTQTATANAGIRASPFDGVELRVAVLFGDEDDEE